MVGEQAGQRWHAVPGEDNDNYNDDLGAEQDDHPPFDNDGMLCLVRITRMMVTLMILALSITPRLIMMLMLMMAIVSNDDGVADGDADDEAAPARCA